MTNSEKRELLRTSALSKARDQAIHEVLALIEEEKEWGEGTFVQLWGGDRIVYCNIGRLRTKIEAMIHG